MEFCLQILFAVGWSGIFGTSKDAEGAAKAGAEAGKTTTNENLTGDLFKGSLNLQELGSCIVLGATTLLVSFIVKLTPDRLLDTIANNKVLDENKDMSDNKMLDRYNKVAEQKIEVGVPSTKKDDDFKKPEGEGDPDKI